MITQTTALAERGISLLAAQWMQTPPPGVTRAFVADFFAQSKDTLRAKLAKLIENLSAHAVQAPDAVLPIAGMPADEWPAAARLAANVAAIRLLASGQTIGAAERSVLLRYSGLGGLSRDALASQVPAEWLPEARAQIHEYFTPTRVAQEIARLLRAVVGTLPTHNGVLWGLEPSAGIGRLVHALAGPGFEHLSLTAVEYSRVSAKMLRAVRPDIHVFEEPFERWVTQNEAQVAGKLGLVVSNPPYGARGASTTEDPNRAYREKKAYAYFLRRSLDLLAPQGVGVFLIPYGFLTGKNSALANLRARVLTRHHLITAYRLPSRLFPGANLVTDLLFFRARGGELSSVTNADEGIANGQYFAQFPQHILGIERGTSKDEDDTSRKPRWGYEIDGEFTKLPDLVERPLCTTCTVTPFYSVPQKPHRPAIPTDALPEDTQAAVLLGKRVAHYLSTLAKGDEASMRTAQGLHAELTDALHAWLKDRSETKADYSPHTDPDLLRLSKQNSELVALLSAFGTDGKLVTSISNAPVYEPRYQGNSDDVAAQAEYLYRTQHRLTLDELIAFRKQLGVTDSGEPLHVRLVAADFCFDDGGWLPARDYYTGNVWPRYDRARALAAQNDGQAQAQAAKLLAAIRPQRLSEIAPEPRMPWVPLSVMQAWLEEWTATPVPKLMWERGLLRPEDTIYSQIESVGQQRLSIAFGYINHDFALFRPPTTKLRDPQTGEEESAEAALGRARLAYGAEAQKHFRDYVTQRPELTTLVEEAYNRQFRGYVLPSYGSEPLDIARWRGRIALKPHQRAGAQRLIANQGGLLSFDVGVGKTYTGMAALAALRQAGRARRPVVLVPNTIVWKWNKDFLAALPDYRVLVVGSERYVGRNGLYTSRIDTPSERALKWRQFQAGAFDVALVTYSVFARNLLRAESVRDWIHRTPALLRELGIQARGMLAGTKEAGQLSKKKRKTTVSESAIRKAVGDDQAEALSDADRARLAEMIALQRDREKEAEHERLLKLLDGITDLSEREQAIVGEAMERWIAERIETRDEPDPGIYWEDLQCDLLMLDEAQNMKNLWAVQAREGGVPKYLGAITEGSDRAWNFALRAAMVQARTGGSGVILLSATPAKNSPLEYFTLLGFVDGQAWIRLGITDPEVFIDRYLRLEMRDIVGTDLSAQRRMVVAGFQQLNELREIVFRYAEFRTAEEVGLKLPETQVEQLRVPMSAAQNVKYEYYLKEYREALKQGRSDVRKRMQALGLLQRMALVAIHPELDQGPLNRKGKTEWTWSNAHTVTDPSCPKLNRVRDLIMEKPECGHLVFCDNVAVHRWLRDLLVAAGLPETRIAVFNADQAPSPLRRQILAEGFNGVAPVLDEQGRIEQEGIAPLYDVVIANATAYEGIDLHVRTCQVYHVDLPWEPATLQQRNGRAVRQGNMQAVIKIFYLLSERSMDAVRLSMILGKLSWMKDILKSADRETNNPAAQSEMNPEELLLYLARDPEEAKAAIEAQKRLLAEEAKERVRRQAWSTLRGLANRGQALRRVQVVVQRDQIRNEMEEQRNYLALVPVETWPWHFLVDAAMAGTPLLFGETWAVASSTAMLRDGFGLEFGEIRQDSIGVRKLGEHRFVALSATAIETQVCEHGDPIQPSDFQRAEKQWPTEQDRAGFMPKLHAAIDDLQRGDFEVLGLDLASDGWRIWLWDTFAAQILAALGNARPAATLLIPVEQHGPVASLELLSASKITEQKVDVLPFHAAHFERFTTLAISSRHKWRVLHGVALAWWGRPFPRGILREPQTGPMVEVQTGNGVLRMRALGRSAHFAITHDEVRGSQHPDGPLFTVTHLASGKAVAQGFQRAELSQVAIEWLETLDTDWNQAEPDRTRLPKDLTTTLSWIRQHENEPTLSDVLDRVRRLKASGT